MGWFDKIKRKFVDPFTYVPMKDDWILLNGMWHHFFETEEAIYFDGVLIQRNKPKRYEDSEEEIGKWKFNNVSCINRALTEEEVIKLYNTGHMPDK